jgi:PhzF family phenazine biosynthesis protein
LGAKTPNFNVADVIVEGGVITEVGQGLRGRDAEVIDASNTIVMPGFGITEDPATGSASGPLGAYLVEHRLVSGAAASRIVSRQGVAMGRASRIHIAIGGEPGAIREVKVGGEAVLVGRGELIPQSA